MKNLSFTIGLTLAGLASIGNINFTLLGGLPGVLLTMFISILGIILAVVFGIINRKRTSAILIFSTSAAVNLYSLIFSESYSQIYHGFERGIIPINVALFIAITVVFVSNHRKKKLNPLA